MNANLIVGLIGLALTLLLLYGPFIWLTYRYSALSASVRFLYIATAPLIFLVLLIANVGLIQWLWPGAFQLLKPGLRPGQLQVMGVAILVLALPAMGGRSLWHRVLLWIDKLV